MRNRVVKPTKSIYICLKNESKFTSNTFISLTAYFGQIFNLFYFSRTSYAQNIVVLGEFKFVLFLLKIGHNWAKKLLKSNYTVDFSVIHKVSAGLMTIFRIFKHAFARFWPRPTTYFVIIGCARSIIYRIFIERMLQCSYNCNNWTLQ